MKNRPAFFALLVLLLPFASAYYMNPYYYRPHDLQAYLYPRIIYQGYGPSYGPGYYDYREFQDFRQKALDVRYGSLEYFKAGYRAASNYEIAFNKGHNDGYYGKQTYFDEDHHMTTWYREAYYNGYHAGVMERILYEHPG